MTDSFFSKLVGVTASNEDGSKRQALIRWFAKPGKTIFLRREPDNPYDKNAIAADIDCRWMLVKLGNRQIGYLSADIAARLAPEIDAGVTWSCLVKDKTGGSSQSRGVNIILRAGTDQTGI